MKAFSPTRAMSEAKAKLWDKIEKNPMIGRPEGLPKHRLEVLMGTKDITHWLEIDGFKLWLLNSSHVSQLIDGALEDVLKEAIAIATMQVTDERNSVKYGDKLKAIEFVARMSGYMPKQAAKAADNEFADMDEDKLDKLINKSIKSQGIAN